MERGARENKTDESGRENKRRKQETLEGEGEKVRRGGQEAETK